MHGATKSTYRLQSRLGEMGKLMEIPQAAGSPEARVKSTGGKPPAVVALMQLQAATRSAVVAASWLSTPRLLQQRP
jgi:hypothetical protein